MGKINVYLADDLERKVRDAGLSLSPICQEALGAALDRLAAVRAGDYARAGFAESLVSVIGDARARAAKSATPRDLLGAILLHGDTIATRALAALGIDLPAPSRPPRGRAPAALSADAVEVLEDGVRTSLSMRHGHVGAEHVLIALAEEGRPLAEILTALGIEADALRRQVERLLASPRPGSPTEATLDRLEAELGRLGAEVSRLRSTTAAAALS